MYSNHDVRLLVATNCESHRSFQSTKAFLAEYLPLKIYVPCPCIYVLLCTCWLSVFVQVVNSVL